MRTFVTKQRTQLLLHLVPTIFLLLGVGDLWTIGKATDGLRDVEAACESSMDSEASGCADAIDRGANYIARQNRRALAHFALGFIFTSSAMFLRCKNKTAIITDGQAQHHEPTDASN